MPNLSRDLKSGRSPDSSDLLSAMKRNTLIAVANSKDAAGKQKSLIKQKGFNTGFLDMNSKSGLDYYNAKGVILRISANGGFLGSFRVLGYNIGSITQADLDAFRIAFAAQFGISNPSLIIITLSPGSLIVNISAPPVSNVSALTSSEKAFFANSGDIISGIQPTTISNIIAQANIPPSSIYQTGPLSIDPASTRINTALDLKGLATQDPSLAQNSYSLYPFPFVGDSINNCMYTLLPGQLKNIVVRININGSIDKICDHVEDNGCSRIFLNGNSTHLIIPSAIEDTISPNAHSSTTPFSNKVYLVNILSGTIVTITLTDLTMNLSQGFDKATERYYYVSAMASNFRKLCYVTIPSFTPDATISATYFTGINTADFDGAEDGSNTYRGTIEFIDSKTALVSSARSISRLDLTGNGTKTIIAGRSTTEAGRWSTPNNSWFDLVVGGPYLDAIDGTNAHFSSITSISYDPDNNRLLVIDSFALRIRSVDLTPGGTYPVTTLAGTSPTFFGLAINGPNTTYGSGELEKLPQVGMWGNGFNAMPQYEKINSSYLDSTFNFFITDPSSIINFNDNIFVVGVREFRRLSNNKVFDFKTSFNTNLIKPVTPVNGGLIGTIKLFGYTIGKLTLDHTSAFNSTFAEEYGITPDIVSVKLSQLTGSELTADFIAAPADASKLTIFDKSFFANADAIIRGIQPSTFSSILSRANIPSSAISIAANVSLDTAFTTINVSLNIIISSKNDSNYNSKIITEFANPFVGDPINGYMYTIINAGTNNIVVRVNKNGIIKKICNHLENNGCRQIFINSDSTYLIIPSNVRDTTSLDAQEPNILVSNKVYLVEISTGVIRTITLNILNANATFGFDKLTRRFYYTSFMSLNYLKLCYVTIPSDFSSTTLTATYYTGVSVSVSGKLEFINSNTAFLSYGSGIQKIDLSNSNGSTSFVAGPPYRYQTGSWSTPVGGEWLNPLAFGPYLDASIGINAFFSFITDISYDSDNNRLLVADYGAQRIRSVDLASGNNYAVTTLAGTSPTFLGLARNNYHNLYSQGVLDTLAQVGPWGQNSMPAYSKVLGSFLTSTFNFPRNLLYFNRKIYVNTSAGTKQLSNGIVSDFSIAYDGSVVVPIPALETFIGTFKINGYQLGTMTPELISRFTLAFALEYNIDPSLLNISFSAGSLITTIYTDRVPDVSILHTSDILFLGNSPNIIRNMTTNDVSRVVTKSAIPSSAIQQTGPLSLEANSTKVNTGTGIVATSASSPTYTQSIVKAFKYPLVADSNNNYIYTLLDGATGKNNSIVRIDVSGNVTTICEHTENNGCKQIFINSDSTYLIIPSNIMIGGGPQPVNVIGINKIYLVNVTTGIINTITLNDYDAVLGQGFCKRLNRYYYASSSQIYRTLCYVTIPSNFSNATLSATFFTNILLEGPGKIEFDSLNDGYLAEYSRITKLYLNVQNGRYEIIAGTKKRDFNDEGIWSSGKLWYSPPDYYGPYLDSPIGANAFFTYIVDVCFDAQNDRLLVADKGAKRIRSIDLTPYNNNYGVSTLAGSTPTLSGLARNSTNSSFSQEYLDIILRVNDWGTFGTKNYTKVNGTYMESTFEDLSSIVFLNDKIIVSELKNTRQLYNGFVSDFGSFQSNASSPSSASPVILNTLLLAQITFNGYSVATLSPDHLQNLTNNFARKYGVNSSLITASFPSGSPVFTINFLVYENTTLTLSDKIFFANIDAIIRGMQPDDIASIIASSEIPSSVISIGENASVINNSIVINKNIISVNNDTIYVNTGLNIVVSSQKDEQIINNKKFFYSPMVVDRINDCIYTFQSLMISGQRSNSIVKIDKTGTLTKSFDYNSASTINQIDINADSSHLIIPNRVGNVSKLELFNIATGRVSTITLTTNIETYGPYGFDKENRRFYYTAPNAKLCYVTIPFEFSSATLAATLFNNISLSVTESAKIQFLDSTTAYVSDRVNIRRLDLSTANGSSTLIAGFDRTQQDGFWESFSGNQVNEFNSESSFFWYTNSTDYGAYLDAPIGTDAFFGSIADISLDLVNNRLLVLDRTCHRIRSVDLTFGNNFAVTTLAGTSPVFKGLARNANATSFSQSVLDSLGQIGQWGGNNMPAYTSTNSSFLSSTFYSPIKMAVLNNRIYVVNNEGDMKQLSNGAVREFSVVQNVSVIQPTNFYFNDNVLPLATIRVNGYTYNTLGPAKLNTFKAALAIKFGGVNPDLLNLSLRSGSFIMDISLDYSRVVFTDLTDNDKAFFSNSDSIFNSVTPAMISSIITATGTGPFIALDGSPVSIVITIENATETGESKYKLKSDCLNEFKTSEKITKFANTFVADPINDCMYTIVGSSIVKIFNNGTIRTIATSPNSSNGCRFIFINSASTHLILPYYDGNTNFNTKNDLISLVNISTSAVTRITLNDLDGASTYGFDKTSNKLYYCSAQAHPDKQNELCFITISNYNQNASLSATFNFSNFNRSINDLTFKGRLEFVNSNTAYYTQVTGIGKLNFSATNGAVTTIAGKPNFLYQNSGFWKNTYPNTNWNNIKLFGPYLDAPIGTDAWFSWVFDISYDSVNNRLLVCDGGAQRIRSVDLSGINFAVTTLAGSSPTLDNVAGTDNTSTYSQTLLNSLKQVGSWNNRINSMPIFRKTNSSYSTSTFKFPINILNFNNKIYVRTLDTLPYDDFSAQSDTEIMNPFMYGTTRQLCNNNVSDFTAIMSTFPPANTSDLQLSVSTLVYEFIDTTASPTFFTNLDSLLQNGTPSAVNVTSPNLRTHYKTISKTGTIPANLFALSGTTIDSGFITSILTGASSGILFPSSYAITIGSSTYRSNSLDNTLTITTGSTSVIIFPGNSFTIDNSELVFLGAGSPGVVVPLNNWEGNIGEPYFYLKYISDTKDAYFEYVENILDGSATPNQNDKRYIFPYSNHWDNFNRDKEKKEFNIPYSYLTDLKGYFNKMSTVYTDNRGLVLKIPLTELLKSNTIKLNQPATLKPHILIEGAYRKINPGINDQRNYPNAPYQTYVGATVLDMRFTGPTLTFDRFSLPEIKLLFKDDTFEFTHSTIYLPLCNCRLVGGNHMAVNVGTNNPINSYPMTSNTITLSFLTTAGFITTGRYYSFYIEATEKVEPFNRFRSSTLEYNKPGIGSIKYNKTTKVLSYNYNLPNAGTIVSTELYVDGNRFYKSLGSGTKEINMINGTEIANLLPFIQNRLLRVYYKSFYSFTYTDLNQGGQKTETLDIGPSEEIIVDLRTNYLNAISANANYVKLIVAATSQGSVDISKTPFDDFFYKSPFANISDKKGKGISYNYNNSILTSESVIRLAQSPVMMINSITPAGNVTLNELYQFVASDSIWVQTPRSEIIYNDNIYYVENVDFVLSITPTANFKYAIVMPQSLYTITNLTITIRANNQIANVFLPSYGVYGTRGISKPGNFGSMMFELLKDVSYTITFDLGVNNSRNVPASLKSTYNTPNNAGISSNNPTTRPVYENLSFIFDGVGNSLGISNQLKVYNNPDKPVRCSLYLPGSALSPYVFTYENDLQNYKKFSFQTLYVQGYVKLKSYNNVYVEYTPEGGTSEDQWVSNSINIKPELVAKHDGEGIVISEDAIWWGDVRLPGQVVVVLKGGEKDYIMTYQVYGANPQSRKISNSVLLDAGVFLHGKSYTSLIVVATTPTETFSSFYFSMIIKPQVGTLTFDSINKRLSWTPVPNPGEYKVYIYTQVRETEIGISKASDGFIQTDTGGYAIYFPTTQRVEVSYRLENNGQFSDMSNVVIMDGRSFNEIRANDEYKDNIRFAPRVSGNIDISRTFFADSLRNNGSHIAQAWMDYPGRGTYYPSKYKRKEGIRYPYGYDGEVFASAFEIVKINSNGDITTGKNHYFDGYRGNDDLGPGPRVVLGSQIYYIQSLDTIIRINPSTPPQGDYGFVFSDALRANARFFILITTDNGPVIAPLPGFAQPNGFDTKSKFDINNGTEFIPRVRENRFDYTKPYSIDYSFNQASGGPIIDGLFNISGMKSMMVSLPKIKNGYTIKFYNIQNYERAG